MLSRSDVLPDKYGPTIAAQRGAEGDFGMVLPFKMRLAYLSFFLKHQSQRHSTPQAVPTIRWDLATDI
jgi:hypothetical protein